MSHQHENPVGPLAARVKDWDKQRRNDADKIREDLQIPLCTQVRTARFARRTGISSDRLLGFMGADITLDDDEMQEIVSRLYGDQAAWNAERGTFDIFARPVPVSPLQVLPDAAEGRECEHPLRPVVLPYGRMPPGDGAAEAAYRRRSARAPA